MFETSGDALHSARRASISASLYRIVSIGMFSYCDMILNVVRTIGTLAAAEAAMEVLEVLPLLLAPLALDRVPGHLLHSREISPCFPPCGGELAESTARRSSASRRSLLNVSIYTQEKDLKKLTSASYDYVYYSGIDCG